MKIRSLYSPCGKEILLDEDDFYKYENTLFTIGVGGRYAMLRDMDNNLYYLHREIMSAQKGFQIDHINMNTLDNRKSNLRVATMSQNRANQVKSSYPKGTSSQYKGVLYDKVNKNWLCRVDYKNEERYNARFSNEHSAALAYNYHAERVFGEFARLNKVSVPYIDNNWRKDRITRKTNSGYRYIYKNPNDTWAFGITSTEGKVNKSFPTIEEAILFSNEYIIKKNLHSLKRYPRVLQQLKIQEFKNLSEAQVLIYEKQLKEIES